MSISKGFVGVAALCAVSDVVIANDCSDKLSFNFLGEEISVAVSEVKEFNELPILRLNTECKDYNGWHLISNLSYKESVGERIFVVNDIYFGDAHIEISKDDKSFHIGRYDLYFSENSVKAQAKPFGYVPAIQLDENSNLDVGHLDVNVLSAERAFSDYILYASIYDTDHDFADKNEREIGTSYNAGIKQTLFDNANIELQYALDSLEIGRQERLSLFFNNKGMAFNRNWSFAAEFNGFDGEASKPDNSLNIYADLYKENMYSDVDVYAAVGGTYSDENEHSIEVGAFLNIASLLKWSEDLSLKAGVARSNTEFENGNRRVEADRFSLQFSMKI